MPVLWEGAENQGDSLRWSGLTGNYIRVLTETDTDVDLTNTITTVELETLVPGAVLGSIPALSRSGIESNPRREPGSLPVVGDS